MGIKATDFYHNNDMVLFIVHSGILLLVSEFFQRLGLHPWRQQSVILSWSVHGCRFWSFHLSCVLPVNCVIVGLVIATQCLISIVTVCHMFVEQYLPSLCFYGFFVINTILFVCVCVWHIYCWESKLQHQKKTGGITVKFV